MAQTNPKVRWVTGRLSAVARAVAIYTVKESGGDWSNLSQADRDTETAKAEAAVREWIAFDVMADYWHEYREADGGGRPIGGLNRKPSR